MVPPSDERRPHFSDKREESGGAEGFFLEFFEAIELCEEVLLLGGRKKRQDFWYVLKRDVLERVIFTGVFTYLVHSGAFSPLSSSSSGLSPNSSSSVWLRGVMSTISAFRSLFTLVFIASSNSSGLL